jgi:AcrR family transcriptional regulator
VLEAADDPLAEIGFAAVTMERIAARAGVGKQTIYRWWPSKTDVLMDAFLDDAFQNLRPPAHLAEAGLSDLVEFRIGDALEVLHQGITAPVDLLLLDGAKPLYFQALKLIEPFLRPGALVIADNINTRMKVSEFTNYVRQPVNGYISVAVPMEDGIELSMRT